MAKYVRKFVRNCHACRVSKASSGKIQDTNQTKLERKFKGPFVIAEILEGDRYILKTLDGKRSYKDSYDRLRKMPDSRVPAELDVASDSNDSDHDDMSTSISEDH